MIVWSICHMKFKMIASHLLLLFLFFHNFDFLGCLREKGDERAKNGPKWQKILSPYLRNCASYDCGFSYTCVKWWYLQQFFSFFQYSKLIFRVFQNSSINVKRKFWGVSHLPHMCVILFLFSPHPLPWVCVLHIDGMFWYYFHLT